MFPKYPKYIVRKMQDAKGRPTKEDEIYSALHAPCANESNILEFGRHYKTSEMPNLQTSNEKPSLRLYHGPRKVHYGKGYINSELEVAPFLEKENISSLHFRHYKLLYQLR